MSDVLSAQEHLDKAHQYESEGRYDEALDECDLAIQANPDFAEAYNTRGILLEALGAMDSAVADYEMAVELDPDSETALQNLYEAQNEAAFIKRQRILGTVLLTAVAYGFSMMLFNVLNEYLRGSITNPLFDVNRILALFLSFLLNLVLISSGIGLGTFLFAHIIGFQRKEEIVVYSVIGFAILYWPFQLMYHFADFLGVNSLFLAGGFGNIFFKLMFALPGALATLLIARTLDNSKNLLLPILAGSTLMVMGFNFQFVWEQAVDFSRFFSAQFNEPQLLLSITYIFASGIVGLMGGAVLGFTLVPALFFSGYIYQTTLPFLDEEAFNLEEEE